MRFGRRRHEVHYRTEKERLAAEQAKEEAITRSQINLEAVMGNHPTKFKIAECLTNDRTYPISKSNYKIPVELVPFKEMER